MEKKNRKEGFDVGFNKKHTGLVTAKGLSCKRESGNTGSIKPVFVIF
jgi:hypothetical protein